MAGKKPIHFTPRDRSVTFSPKPRATSRRRRGQVIQFETAGVPDAARAEEQVDAPGTEDGDGPVPAPAQAGGPPRLIDADGGPPQHGAAATQRVGERAHDPDEGVKLLIMHAVSGWVAVVMERAVYSIQIAPVGSGSFQVETALLGADGVVARQPEVLYLRVSCALGKGRMVRTEVQPLRPR